MSFLHSLLSHRSKTDEQFKTDTNSQKLYRTPYVRLLRPTLPPVPPFGEPNCHTGVGSYIRGVYSRAISVSTVEGIASTPRVTARRFYEVSHVRVETWPGTGKGV